MESILVFTFTFILAIQLASSTTHIDHNGTDTLDHHPNSSNHTSTGSLNNCNHATPHLGLCCRSQNLVPMYVYYNWDLEDHFYTIDYELYGAGMAGNHGYKLVGIEFNIWKDPISGGSPLYAYYNAKLKKHLYTFKWLKHDKLGYIYESILGYAFQNPKTGLIPIYHFHDSVNGDNIYTAEIDLETPIGAPYEFHGIRGYACRFSGSR